MENYDSIEHTIFSDLLGEYVDPQEARRFVFERFDRATPSKLLLVYDRASEMDEFDVIELIADYAISRISNVNLQNDMSELFAICDSLLLNSRQQG